MSEVFGIDEIYVHERSSRLSLVGGVLSEGRRYTRIQTGSKASLTVGSDHARSHFLDQSLAIRCQRYIRYSSLLESHRTDQLSFEMSPSSGERYVDIHDVR